MRLMTTVRPAAATLLAVLAACAGPAEERPPADVGATARADSVAHIPMLPASGSADLPASAAAGMEVRPSERSAAQLRIWLATPDDAELCPAELLVTDPLGRRIGLDPGAGSLLRELPGAVYDEDSLALPARSPCGQTDEMEATPRVVLDEPATGEYAVDVIGKAPGRFSLYVDIQPTDWRTPSRRDTIGAGLIARGEVARFTFRIGG